MRRISLLATALVAAPLACAHAAGVVSLATDGAGRPVVGDAGGAPPAEPVAPSDIPTDPTRSAATATPGHPAPHKVFNTASPHPR